MRDLPTGTVTFVFTDIEGSTGLVTRLGEGYREVLEAHNRILRAAFSAGIEVSTEGDAFFVAYTAAPQAVAEAVEAQRAIVKTSWPEGVEVRVRIGMHTGEAVPGADNYVGIDVNRAARIMAVGHGGQILVSATTHALSEHATPEGIAFRDLGEHRLRDIPNPEHLYQVVAEGLPDEFPALHSVDARPNNLPMPLTTFVGRRRELDELKESVGQARLVTLTGPGGTGKTRLSIEAARELLPDFENGAFFVPLAPITDPALVVPTIGDALGVHEAAERAPLDQLIEHLRESEVLIVLDNLEQVVEAATDVGRLLTGTDRVRFLATSREPLGLHGEREYPVPPLDLPDLAHLPSLESMSQYAAVELFIERATAVRPGFEVTNENAPAVAEICSSLDGLPLAIELAAARVKILSPDDILRRLEDRLGFLTGGGRDRPGRQQTLRDAIAWSYDLLDEEERTLFSSLAVFSRGFRLEAAEEVCGRPGSPEVFDGVASLVNKSLIRQIEGAGGETRFLMLETIREFAVERLDDSVGNEEVRRRHASYFFELAERAAPNLFGAEQGKWLEILGAEHDNFRAALAWAERAGEAETALKLAGALWRFWQMRGHLREAAERFKEVLALQGAEAYPEARAEALEGAGGVSYWMGDWDTAEAYYGECLKLRRELGDERRIADAAYNMAFVYTVPPEPRRDVARSRPFLQEALDRYRALDDRRGVANVLWALSNIHLVSEEWRACADTAEEALGLFDALGDRFGAAWAAHTVGLALTPLGETVQARRSFERAMGMFSEAGDITGIGLVLNDFAALAAAERDFERAIRLRGAAEVIEREAGQALVSNLDSYYGWVPDVSESDIAPEEQARLRAEGEAFSTEEAVEYALGGKSAEAEVP
ncbi:MAG: adenylate/guanylate cyclase domain-containing protein [Actinomycetota bacterium]